MESLKEKLEGIERMKAAAKAQEKAEAKEITILLRPLVYAAAKQKCADEGISLDAAVNFLLAKWAEDTRTIGGKVRHMERDR